VTRYLYRVCPYGDHTKFPQLNLTHSFVYRSMLSSSVNLLHRVLSLFGCFCLMFVCFCIWLPTIAFLTLPNRRQKVFNRGTLQFCGGFAFVCGAWDYKINQNSTYLQCFTPQFGGAWSFVRGAKSTKGPPWRRDCNTTHKVINGVGWQDGHHGPSPILYDTVTLVFTLIRYFAIVVWFILTSTDNWFRYCAMAISIVSVS